MELTGRCLCKAVDYRIAEAPVTARACWCRMCQTIGGGSGTVNALFNTTALTVNGHLRESTRPRRVIHLAGLTAAKRTLGGYNLREGRGEAERYNVTLKAKGTSQ
jgi:hypothetical protein